MTELGGELDLDSGTLTPLLKRMEINNLIRRERSKEDERVVLIKLTNTGAALNHLSDNVIRVSGK